MRVLVTGGRGMLGSATAQALVHAGHDVTVMQRGVAPVDVPQIHVDISDEDAVIHHVRGYEAIVHMAARVTTVGRWSEFERVNVVGTKNMLTAARASGVERFVYVSSPSVAHQGRSLIGSAADPASPAHATSFYSRSKAIAERAVLAESDFATVAIRPHLVWGPGDTQLIARIVERAKQGRLVLINGGTALIDTTYVDNAADAMVQGLAHAPDFGVRGLPFVISNGEPRTIKELFTAITQAAGAPAPTRSIPAPVARVAGTLVEGMWRVLNRQDEPPMTRFLAEQLSTAHWFAQKEVREALHWEPRIGLDEGFARLAQWYTGVASQPSK
jgi:2-alkyl-3-oxoalkanoate reductase